MPATLPPTIGCMARKAAAATSARPATSTISSTRLTESQPVDVHATSIVSGQQVLAPRRQFRGDGPLRRRLGVHADLYGDGLQDLPEGARRDLRRRQGAVSRRLQAARCHRRQRRLEGDDDRKRPDGGAVGAGRHLEERSGLADFAGRSDWPRPGSASKSIAKLPCRRDRKTRSIRLRMLDELEEADIHVRNSRHLRLRKARAGSPPR